MKSTLALSLLVPLCLCVCVCVCRSGPATCCPGSWISVQATRLSPISSSFLSAFTPAIHQLVTSPVYQLLLFSNLSPDYCLSYGRLTFISHSEESAVPVFYACASGSLHPHVFLLARLLAISAHLWPARLTCLFPIHAQVSFAIFQNQNENWLHWQSLCSLHKKKLFSKNQGQEELNKGTLKKVRNKEQCLDSFVLCM